MYALAFCHFVFILTTQICVLDLSLLFLVSVESVLSKCGIKRILKFVCLMILYLLYPLMETVLLVDQIVIKFHSYSQL